MNKNYRISVLTNSAVDMYNERIEKGLVDDESADIAFAALECLKDGDPWEAAELAATAQTVEAHNRKDGCSEWKQFALCIIQIVRIVYGYERTSHA